MSRASTRVSAALAAIGMLTLGGPATAVVAGPVDGVAAALLVAADVPAGMTPLGIKDATDFDIDAASFEASGGLDKADQIWQLPVEDQTEPVVAVIDFRMLFPDATAAQAYLDDAELVLSESVTGLTLQADAPAIGEVVRHYAGELTSGSLTLHAQNFLFREGPVVAKVYVIGFDTTLDDALPIAQAAADRTATWLTEAPMASPGTSAPASSPEPSIPAGSPVAPVSAPGATPDASGVVPATSPAAAGTELRQWASEATASSQYGSDSWSADQATGAPDVPAYLDDARAWAAANSDGTIEWLEVGYTQAVLPKAISIVESYGNGAVVMVEAFDTDSDSWVELWSGTDTSAPDEVAVFSPEIETGAFATDRLRITLGDIVPGWSEIDAVELVGIAP